MSQELPSLAESALADGPLLLEVDRIVRGGLADRRAAFELRVLALPADFGFAVVGGVHALSERLSSATVQRAAFAEAGDRLGLSDATVARLAATRFSLDVDAMLDGTLAFAGEVVVGLVGPYVEALIAASVSLPWIRRATSIATAAARLSLAADGDTLVERASSAEIDRLQAAFVARAAFVGGCDATANPVAAAILELPLRAALERPSAAPPQAARDPEGWSSLPPETWIELARGDEESSLVEAHRLGQRPTGWWVPSLGRVEIPMTCDLVAVEEGGAWRAGPCEQPGRKIAVRYFDARGHLLRDVIHLADERLREASGLDATSMEPLARPILRQGRAVAEPESPRDGRARARAGRLLAPAGVLRLHRPTPFPVSRSEGLRKATTPSRAERRGGP